MRETSISGQVRDAQTAVPLPGVIVSDGETSVVTDGDGRYTLDPGAAAEFLFVVVPGTHQALSDFWIDLRDVAARPAQHDFVLRPRSDGAPAAFQFVQVTDLHLREDTPSSPTLDDYLLAQMALPGVAPDRPVFYGHSTAATLSDDLQQIVTRHPDVAFVAATGDLTDNGTPGEFAAFRAVQAAAPRPLATVVGNHDTMSRMLDLLLTPTADGQPALAFDPGRIDADTRYHAISGASPAHVDAGRSPFLDALGPPYYAFWWGSLHVIVYDLDGQARHPDLYPQDRWLATHLALLPAQTPILLLQHFPFSLRQAAFWAEQAQRPLASLSGHWHCSRVIVSDGTAHYSTPTLGMGGIDWSPRGYRLFSWDGTELHGQMLSLSDEAPSTAGYGADGGPAQLERRITDTGHWPQFAGGPQRNAVAPPLTGPLELAWQRPLPGVPNLGSPVVADGLLVIGLQQEHGPGGGTLVALDVADGALRWSRPVGASIKHTPALADGLVLTTTVDGCVVACDLRSGEIHWRYQAEPQLERWVYSAPLVAHDRVYTGGAAAFAALELHSGRPLWERRDLTGSDWIASYSSPAASDESIFAGFFWSGIELIALDAATGATRWQRSGSMHRSLAASPVLVNDGIVVVDGHGVLRYLAQQDGSVRWETVLDAPWTVATPVTDGELVYAVGVTGAVFAVSLADGTIAWRHDLPQVHDERFPYHRNAGGHLGSPVLSGEQLIVAANTGTLYALSRTGALLWEAACDGPVCSTPAVTTGALYVALATGAIQAWAPRTAEPA